MKIKKIIIISVIITFTSILFSCYYIFKNPVDPQSPNFVGYEVIDGVNSVSLNNGSSKEDLVYPYLSWTNISGALYNLQISKNPEFEKKDIVYNKTLSNNKTYLHKKFSASSYWFYNEDNLLENLPTGKYYWRVRVKNSKTKGAWGTWSKVGTFNQVYKLVSATWDNDSERYEYSYSEDMLTEKKDIYRKLAEYEYYQSVVTEFNKDGKKLFEYTFNTKNCKPSSIKSKKIFEHTNNYSGKLEYLITYNNSLSASNILEFEKYSYNEKGDLSSKDYYVKRDGANITSLDDVYNNPEIKFYKKQHRDYNYFNENLDTVKISAYNPNGTQMIDGELCIVDEKIISFKSFNVDPQGVKTLKYIYSLKYSEEYPEKRVSINFFELDSTDADDDGDFQEFIQNLKFTYLYNEAEEPESNDSGNIVIIIPNSVNSFEEFLNPFN